MSKSIQTFDSAAKRGAHGACYIEAGAITQDAKPQTLWNKPKPANKKKRSLWGRSIMSKPKHNSLEIIRFVVAREKKLNISNSARQVFDSAKALANESNPSLRCVAEMHKRLSDCTRNGGIRPK